LLRTLTCNKKQGYEHTVKKKASKKKKGHKKNFDPQ